MVLPEMAHAHDADSQPLSCRPPTFPRAAVLAQMLGLDELQQALHLGAEVTVRLEDLGGMAGGHPRAVDQPVRLVQGRRWLRR